MVLPPVADNVTTDIKRQHEHHAKSHITHPVTSVLYRRWFGMQPNAAVALRKCIWASYRIADGTSRNAGGIVILIVRLVILTDSAAGSRRNVTNTPLRL